MTKEGYIRRQKVIQNRLIRSYVQPVYDALHSQVRPYIDMVRMKGVEYAYGQAKTHHGLNMEIGSVLRSLYRDAANLAKPNLRIGKSISGAFGINPGFVQDVLDYFAKFLFDKIVIPITRTTQMDIEAMLQKAIEEGWGIDKTVSELDKSTIPPWRARMIVRTESVRAMNASQWLAAGDENYEVEKIWIAVEDQRTRLAHTHVSLDGQVRDLFDDFDSILGPILFPGDPEADPGNTINCRCTLGYNYKRDLNGDLVPKQNFSMQLQ